MTMRPPPLHDEVDEADTADPPTLARSSREAIESDPATTVSRSTAPVIEHRVAFPAPQFSPPLNPQPFVVPPAPNTRRIVAPDEESEPSAQLEPSVPRQTSVRIETSVEPHAVRPENLQPESEQPALPVTSRRPLILPTLMEQPKPSSLAPVAMSAAYRRAAPTLQLRAHRRSSTFGAIMALLVVALSSGAVIGVAFVPNALERGRAAIMDRLKVRRAPEQPAAASAVDTAPPVAPPSAVDPVVVPPVSPETPEIDSDFTLVTLPESARGHRIYVDGRVMTVGAEPIKVKCGMHTIKIGSSGKPRSIELPCGRDLTIVE